MKSYAVVFAPEAKRQLADLYLYIATHGSPSVAARYANAVVAFCEGLATFPLRGAARDDVRPGLRITNYKGRTIIAFSVDQVLERVSILGAFYGGQDYEAALGRRLGD